MNDTEWRRYRSRTFVLVVMVIMLSTMLLWEQKLADGIWETVVIATFGMWQLRRYGDNRLLAGEDK